MMMLGGKSLSLFNNFSGLRIVEDASMTDFHEDWSRVRSPGRARRRMKRGHRQNIKFWQRPKTVAYRVGDTLVMHPALADQLRKESALRGRDSNQGDTPDDTHGV